MSIINPRDKLLTYKSEIKIHVNMVNFKMVPIIAEITHLKTKHNGYYFIKQFLMIFSHSKHMHTIKITCGCTIWFRCDNCLLFSFDCLSSCFHLAMVGRIVYNSIIDGRIRKMVSMDHVPQHIKL